jgi:hypothetical protein
MPIGKEGPKERHSRQREAERLGEKQWRKEYYRNNPRKVLPQPGVGEGWNAGSGKHGAPGRVADMLNPLRMDRMSREQALERIGDLNKDEGFMLRYREGQPEEMTVMRRLHEIAYP